MMPDQIDSEQVYRGRVLETYRQSTPGGPFQPLVFSQLPDNFEPVSLMGNLWAIHETINSLIRKMIRQANRQKDVTVYAGPENDAIRARDTPDGGMCRVASPDSMTIMSLAVRSPSAPLSERVHRCHLSPLHMLRKSRSKDG